jgi:hypothetical protein
VETTPYLINNKRGVHILPVQSVQPKLAIGDVNISTLYEAAHSKLHAEQWTRGEHLRNTTDRVDAKIYHAPPLVVALVERWLEWWLEYWFWQILGGTAAKVARFVWRSYTVSGHPFWKRGRGAHGAMQCGAETHLIEHPSSWSTRVL